MRTPSAGPTIRSRLRLLVVSCVLPGALAAALYTVYSYQRERAALTQDTIETARTLAHAVDRELASAEAGLQALAGLLQECGIAADEAKRRALDAYIRVEGAMVLARTLNRLELSRGEPTRYHKIAHDGAAIERLFVELFVEAHATAPAEIVLDLDATDDPVHGEQEGRFAGAAGGASSARPSTPRRGVSGILCAREPWLTLRRRPRDAYQARTS